MNSIFLDSIGLGNLDIGYVLVGLVASIVILLILIIVQIVKTSKLQKRYNKFMRGKEVKSLEKEIIGLFEDNKFLKTATEKNKKDISILYKKFESAFQKVGLVKYDAFNQMGGKLSFSLALLDENNNGVIINSVHSAEGCYCYSKDIRRGQCNISLGAEEKQALDIAMGEEEE